MDRITHQPKTTRLWINIKSYERFLEAHAEARKKEEGIESKNQAVSLGRTIRPGGADCPQRPRGQSGQVPRTVRKGHADRPAGNHGPSIKDNRTTRTDPRKTDRPRRPGAPSARVPDRPLLKLGPSANRLQREPKAKSDRKQSRARTRRTREEHTPRGLSATTSRTVRTAWTEQKNCSTPRVNSPNPSPDLPRVWDKLSVKQGCYTPKISPPNFLNHRESWIL
jgi:hypothetical protein